MNSSSKKTQTESLHNNDDSSTIKAIREVPGVVYGNISSASTNYDMDKFVTPKGHGFAAEYGNTLCDKLQGKSADIVGFDNAKHGADRLVDGIQIQSKYCNSGSKCIQECFDKGQMKYTILENGVKKPMEIEVPSDMYDDAVRAMENRIKNGEVPNTTNPEEAKIIVRKGHFTYKQAVNITKAGTIESITYDAVNGAITSIYPFGISTAMTFAVSVWNGDDIDIALEKATFTGLKVGGVAFMTSVLSSQLSRTALNSALVGTTDGIVSIIGPKASQVLVNAFRSGNNIYGAAAMKSASKLLRGNVITGAVSVAVLSSFDVVNIFRGRISGKQLFKNVANTTSSVAGGGAGWAIGSALGSIVLGVGTVVGGVLGSLIGGGLANKASSSVLDKFIEDDANEMVQIIEDRFKVLANDYILNEQECKKVVKKLQEKLSGEVIREMYSRSDREKFADKILTKIIERQVSKRSTITLPTNDQLTEGLKSILENMDTKEVCCN